MTAASVMGGIATAHASWLGASTDPERSMAGQRSGRLDAGATTFIHNLETSLWTDLEGRDRQPVTSHARRHVDNSGGPMTQPQPTSFARIIITPIILIVAGYLILGLPGAGVGAVIGIVYILWASRRGK